MTSPEHTPYVRPWWVEWIPWVGICVIFPIVAGVFIAERVSEGRARESLLSSINAASAVLLDARPLDHSDAILAALRSVHHVDPHHTGPVSPLHLELIAGPRVVAITIARDSDTPGEYWVYRPGKNWHGDPLGQEAGRITDPALDSLLPWPNR